jgi:hypothetical protein
MVINTKIPRAGRSMKSSQPRILDRPTAPSNITSAGVKQQIAATIVPMIPVLRRTLVFIAWLYLGERNASSDG